MATQKFEQRMGALNHLMSNQSLIPLPVDGSIEQTQYSFGGMSDVLQLFQLDLSGAAQIPITRLFGRTYNGLGQAGDGDERIYEEKISTDQSTYLVPQLETLYPVICMSELGEVPDDLDLICPSIRVLGEQEKSDLAKSVADTTTVYLNGGIMSPRKVAQEVKRSSDVTGIGATLDDEYIAKLSDDVQSEGELGEGLFGGEGGGLNEASSPAKAIKGENEKAKQDEPAKEDLGKKASKAQDAAPAMDVLPSGLKVGERVLVNGKLLTVRNVVEGTVDLFDEPTVQVMFTTGEIIAYRPDSDIKVRTGDARWADLAQDFRRVATKHGLSANLAPAGTKDFYSQGGRISLGDLSAVAVHPDGSWAHQTGHWAGKRGTLPKDGGSGVGAASLDAYLTILLRGKATDEDGASSVTQRATELMEYHALPVRVESRQGEARTGITPAGKSWRTIMPADYGFIDMGINGSDGDSIDCYVGTSPESNNVYVIDQYDLSGEKFDEHKVMLGYHTQESAVEDYMLGHHLSNKTFAAVTSFTMPMFRKWLRTHDTSLPCNADVGR
jgi:hypothetical protein